MKNRLDGRRYAIKRVCLKHLDPMNAGTADYHVASEDAQNWRMNLREVRAMASLEHPNLVRYHQSWLEISQDKLVTDGMSDGSTSYESSSRTSSSNSSDIDGQAPSLVLCIQMEYVDGQSLAQLLQRRDQARTPLATDEIVSIFAQVLQAVAHIHAGGWSHHDLKPENIFLRNVTSSDPVGRVGDAACTAGTGAGASRRRFEVKVGDFGLCARNFSVAIGDGSDDEAEDDIHDDDGAVGTFAYAPPERLGRATAVSAGSTEGGVDAAPDAEDVYSLGVTLLELVYPFFGTAMERVRVLQALRGGDLPTSLREAGCAAANGAGRDEGRREALARLALAMADAEPSRRPTVASAVTIVGALSVATAPGVRELLRRPTINSRVGNQRIDTGQLRCDRTATPVGPEVLALENKLAERDAEIAVLRQLVCELLGDEGRAAQFAV